MAATSAGLSAGGHHGPWFTGPAIEDGYLFVFDALLWESSAVLPRLPKLRRERLRLEPHDELRRLLREAGTATIYGDVENLRAYALRQPGAVAVEFEGRSDAFAASELLLFSKADERLCRTLVLLGLNLRLHQVSFDAVLALLHSAFAPAKRRRARDDARLRVVADDTEYPTLGGLLDDLRSALVASMPAPSVDIPGRRWCVEIRSIEQPQPAAEFVKTNREALYGLLHADEGWRDVPAARAEQQAAQAWSTRDYLAVLAEPSGSVVVNLEPARTVSRAAAASWSRESVGVDLRHLALAGSRVAGIDHGVLVVLQRSILRLLAARELEETLFKLSRAVAPVPPGERRGRSLRRLFGWVRLPALFEVLYRPSPTLYKDLLRVTRASVTEVATFEAFMDARVGATSLLEGLHRAAELVDIELRDQRLLALNWLVVGLGALTILLTAVQVVAAVAAAM